MSSEILTGAYLELLDDLKNRIHNSRVHAALSVNRELVLLYWQIGASDPGAPGSGRLGAQRSSNVGRRLNA